jgi:hypothetical protein
MHIPEIFQDHPFRLALIMWSYHVGNLNKQAEQEFGQKLSPNLSDERTLFLISSDFAIGLLTSTTTPMT